MHRLCEFWAQNEPTQPTFLLDFAKRTCGDVLPFLQLSFGQVPLVQAIDPKDLSALIFDPTACCSHRNVVVLLRHG